MKTAITITSSVIPLLRHLPWLTGKRELSKLNLRNGSIPSNPSDVMTSVNLTQPLCHHVLSATE
jgi:hypothetical protein